MHPKFSALHTSTSMLLCLVAINLTGLQSSMSGASTPPAAAIEEIDPAVVDFLQQSVRNRLTAIAAGRIAQSHASAPEVSAYATRMMGEESLLLSRLQALAGKLGVPVPDELNEKSIEKLEQLQAREPDDFGKAFWNLLSDAYGRDLISFDFAGKLENIDVRQFAVQYRPMFERQLDEIGKLRKPAA